VGYGNSTKPAISLKRGKIQRKLLLTADIVRHELSVGDKTYDLE